MCPQVCSTQAVVQGGITLGKRCCTRAEECECLGGLSVALQQQAACWHNLQGRFVKASSSVLGVTQLRVHAGQGGVDCQPNPVLHAMRGAVQHRFFVPPVQHERQSLVWHVCALIR